MSKPRFSRHLPQRAKWFLTKELLSELKEGTDNWNIVIRLYIQLRLSSLITFLHLLHPAVNTADILKQNYISLILHTPNTSPRRPYKSILSISFIHPRSSLPPSHPSFLCGPLLRRGNGSSSFNNSLPLRTGCVCIAGRCRRE